MFAKNDLPPEGQDPVDIGNQWPAGIRPSVASPPDPTMWAKDGTQRRLAWWQRPLEVLDDKHLADDSVVCPHDAKG